MGVLTRCQSLPNRIDQLPEYGDVDFVMKPDSFEAELESVTSTTSIKDILHMVQENRSHTVHGTNVYMLMKAAADARALDISEFIPPPAILESESDDMWLWEGDTCAMEEEESMWVWQTDKKVAAFEALENRLAECIWDWQGDAPIEEETEEEQEAARAVTWKESVEPVFGYWDCTAQLKGKAPAMQKPTSDEFWDWSLPSHL